MSSFLYIRVAVMCEPSITKRQWLIPDLWLLTYPLPIPFHTLVPFLWSL